MIAVLCGFFAFGLARLIVFERGPYDIFGKFRRLMGIHERDEADAGALNRYMVENPKTEEIPDRFAFTEHGMLFSCPYCTATWVAFIGALVQYDSWQGLFVNWLAGVGVAFLLLDLMEYLNRGEK